MPSIWIPGRGEYDTRAARVDKAVREYNERLFFDKNVETGDWCVFVRMPAPEPPVAVHGFGQSIPEPDEVIKAVWKSDSARHGEKIFDEFMKSQERFIAHKKYLADEATGESAEHIEFLMRKHGKSPVIKSLPKGVSASDA